MGWVCRAFRSGDRGTPPLFPSFLSGGAAPAVRASGSIVRRHGGPHAVARGSTISSRTCQRNSNPYLAISATYSGTVGRTAEAFSKGRGSTKNDAGANLSTPPASGVTPANHPQEE